MTPPENPRRRSRADVADMALRLLDETGLPDLTMRRLADALGVQPSALYWHFPSKQALLAAVSERILAPVSDADVNGLSMHESLRALGGRLRDSLLAYRDGAELVSSSLALDLVTSPIGPKLASVARQQGASSALVRVAAAAVTHFVVGYVFHEQQRLQADALGLLAEPAALVPEAAADPAISSPSDDFDAALRMIADGLDASRVGAESAAS